jgi:hypothetical protein
MREREAAKKTKLSSFRFFFDRTFAKKRGRKKKAKRRRFVSLVCRGQKRKEKKNSLSLSLSSS